MREKLVAAAQDALDSTWRENSRVQAEAAADAILDTLCEPTEEMWGGLPRSLMMWMDMHPKTPRALFKHLAASGLKTPVWLSDESEFEHLDHVPSKGTRCVILFKAMIDAIKNEKRTGKQSGKPGLCTRGNG